MMCTCGRCRCMEAHVKQKEQDLRIVYDAQLAALRKGPTSVHVPVLLVAQVTDPTLARRDRLNSLRSLCARVFTLDSDHGKGATLWVEANVPPEINNVLRSDGIYKTLTEAIDAEDKLALESYLDKKE